MNILIRAKFICVICSKEAGLITLSKSEDGHQVVRQSFTSHMTSRVSSADVASVESAIKRESARDLFRCDLEYAPFYCPNCDASYCGNHWQRHDVFDNDDGFSWHDSIRGRCPEGHERKLED